MTFIVPIVEGHGEVEAVPILLQRMAEIAIPGRYIKVNHPIRIKAGSFLNDCDYFNKYIILASSKAAQAGGFVFILLDCEDDCTAILGPNILRKARAIRDDITYIVVLAYREYESWFLAAASSLRGLYGLPGDLEPPVDVETIRDAKGWLERQMDRSYDETTHQMEFSKKFDMALARSNDSFNRCFDRVTAALAAS